MKTEENIHFRDYVYLSLFTGARQNNILSMRWEQIDFRLALWHIPITKNKESHTLPLTELALQVLRDRYKHRKDDIQWVFPTIRNSKTGHMEKPKEAWKRFLNRLGLQNLRMHDLRRTLSSYMAMNNNSLNVIGKVLGHKSPTSTQIYSRLTIHPLKQAMEAAQMSMAANADILPEHMHEVEPPRPRLRRIKSALSLQD